MSPSEDSAKSDSTSVLPGRIAERAGHFSGRAWVFAEIDQWLALAGGPRYFLITGEPGSGKTAIAVRLFQFSSGGFPANGHAHLGPRSISAAHFCSAGDAASIDPRTFATSIAIQLSSGSPAYAQALKNVGDKAINIEINATIGRVDTFTGLVIQSLDVSRLSAQDAFNRVVLDPLREMREPFTVLVDSLDEALNHSGDVNIVKLLSNLESLPPGIRFILTSRQDGRIESRFATAAGLLISEARYTNRNHDDILQYVRLRAKAPELAAAGAGLPERLAGKADGNFQYAKFVVDAISSGRMNAEALDGLPPGLDPIYRDSLARVVDLGKKDWSAQYAPVMGVLSVAQEHLTLDQLRRLSRQPESVVWSCLTDLQQFVESDECQEPRYSLYHYSVTEFLHRRQIAMPKKYWNNPFYLPPAEYHRSVADYYRAGQVNGWDAYGLRFKPAHLAQAARLSSGQERHESVAELVRLTTDPQFYTVHMARLRDLPRLQSDLQESLQVAALDDEPEGLELVVESALAIVNFRRNELRPEPLFDLAAQGYVDLAVRRLTLFGIDEEWRQIAMALIAWLSWGANPQDALALRARVGAMQPLSSRAARLLAFLDSRIGSPPPLRMPLPPAPQPEVVEAIVDRMGGGGAGSATELLVNNIPAVANPSLRANEGYLSQLDGPFLVAFAEIDPSRGREWIAQYIGIHTNYHYLEYRNRSLAFLLDAVLNHSGERWIQAVAREIASSALAGSRSDFQETLPLAVLALRAASDSGASKRSRYAAHAGLQAHTDRELDAALRLQTGRQADPFSSSKRQLAALCESYGFLNIRNCDFLIRPALAILQKGFAGFSAPAALTVAEAVEIAGTAVPDALQMTLDAALSAAHNVQDPLFCARTTARVNAMRTFWWSPFDLPATVRRFCREPDRTEFCPVHFAGETFHHRSPDSMELSYELRNAGTLEEIAKTFRQPTGELTSRNPDLPRDRKLQPNTPVRLPDPGFSTWLAARFAGRALADRSLAPDQLVSMLRSLVPLAAANPTTLDSVLARLVLAARPASEAALTRIGTLARNAVAGPGALDASLPA